MGLFKQFFYKTSIMFSSSPKFQGQITRKKGSRNWWLFHAADFQSLMFPCFAFCRILGIFPYKINGSFFKISKSYYFLSTAIMCVFCLFMLIVLINISEWYESAINNDVRKSIKLYSFYILSSFITIITYVLSSPRMHLLQTILKNSSKLSSKTYQKQSILIHAKDIFGFSFLFGYALICYYDIQLSILLKVFPTYISLVVFQMDMLYTNCVCVLKACFKKINDDLTNLFIMHDEPHLMDNHIRWIYRERNSLLLMKLKALKKQHLIVSDTVQMLNRIFSPQLLVTIVIIFFGITLDVYFDIIHWQNGLSIKLIKQLYYKSVLVHVVYYTMKLILIAWVCETGKNEAIKIRTTIHDVLNNTNDEQIKYELRLFSLQILHCDNTFSAKYFTLDATLLTTIMGTISTYLLILVQFLYMSHSCDEKNAINVA